MVLCQSLFLCDRHAIGNDTGTKEGRLFDSNKLNYSIFNHHGNVAFSYQVISVCVCVCERDVYVYI